MWGCDVALWRTVQVWKDDGWVEVERGGVNKGGTFRLFEPDGTLVMDREGNEQWVALSDSMPTEPEGNFMVHVEESTLTDHNIDIEDDTQYK